MSVKLLRRFLALLITTAYLGAAMVQLAPSSDAASAPMQSGMAMHQPDGSGDPMPCHNKGMPPGCMTDLGCVFLVSLPALPALTLVTRAAWSSVDYGGAEQRLHGRSIKPALGPPISLA